MVLNFERDRRPLISQERPPLFLGQIQECMLEGDTDGYAQSRHGPILSIDHLIPNLAVRQNKRLFSDISERQENKVCLCNGSVGACHYKRDHHPEFGKIKIYRRFNVHGLVQDLAAYPRATKHESYVLQYHQWRELFVLIRDNLRREIKSQKVSLHKISDYSSASDAVEYHLYKWERGNFDVRMPALAYLLQD